jgi:hypothetical protein
MVQGAGGSRLVAIVAIGGSVGARGAASGSKVCKAQDTETSEQNVIETSNAYNYWHWPCFTFGI